jgi:hypothetical protein
VEIIIAKLTTSVAIPIFVGASFGATEILKISYPTINSAFDYMSLTIASSPRSLPERTRGRSMQYHPI